VQDAKETSYRSTVSAFRTILRAEGPRVRTIKTCSTWSYSVRSTLLVLNMTVCACVVLLCRHCSKECFRQSLALRLHGACISTCTTSLRIGGWHISARPYLHLQLLLVVQLLPLLPYLKASSDRSRICRVGLQQVCLYYNATASVARLPDRYARTI
jgi:hypothetical protein